MEYMMNSTLQAAATLLPYGTYLHSSKEQMIDIYPPSIQIPTNPFAVFDKAWSLLNHQSTSEFRFTPGRTPLATFSEAGGAIALYYLIIFGGREVMRSQPALKLNTLFIIHNFYLTAISGGLLLLFAQQLIPGLWRHGLYDGICGATGWSQQLLVLYYVNYLTKFLELLDTVFLVLKKKPLTFLHTYHHGATALLCYTQLVGQTSVSWVPITLNLAVHVVMYWYVTHHTILSGAHTDMMSRYYFQSARGVKIWWKKYITMFQITQFVLDLGFIYFACWNYFSSEYMPALPHYGTCGEKQQETAAFTGCAILTSYLVLFIMFYLSTYKKPAATKKAFRRASKSEVQTIQETGGIAADAIKQASHAIAETLHEEKQKCATGAR
jgi:fatty acid elongase 3